ncbi:MAG: transposase [Pseudonocardiaceae bacterium]
MDAARPGLRRRPPRAPAAGPARRPHHRHPHRHAQPRAPHRRARRRDRRAGHRSRRPRRRHRSHPDQHVRRRYRHRRTTAGHRRDNPERLRSEASLARLLGIAPIPASSGNTTRHRLHRGGDRHGNCAVYRIAVVRLGHHAGTQEYLTARTAQGKTKPMIIRSLKRYLVREIYRALMTDLNDLENTPSAA